MILQRRNGEINPAWVIARQGKVGASQVGQILKPTTGKRATGQAAGSESKQRFALAAEIAVERMFGRMEDRLSPNIPAIARGIRLEPQVLAKYMLVKKTLLIPPAWFEHRHIPLSGATPDGVDRKHRGTVQIKTATQQRWSVWVRQGEIPNEYLAQVVWEQAVMKTYGLGEWTDFVLYCEELPPGQQMWIHRYVAPPALITAYEEQVREFLKEVEAGFSAVEQTELH